MDKTPAESLGYAFATILVSVINNQFVGKSFGEAGIKDTPILGWIVMMAVGAVTLALPEGSASAPITE